MVTNYLITHGHGELLVWKAVRGIAGVFIDVVGKVEVDAP